MLINVNIFMLTKSEAIQFCADHNLFLLEYDHKNKEKNPSLLIMGDEEPILKFKNLYFHKYTDEEFMKIFFIDSSYKEIMHQRYLISLNKELKGKMFFEITDEVNFDNGITAYRLQFFNDNKTVEDFILSLNYQNALYLLINDVNVLGLYLFEVLNDAEIELEGLQKLYKDEAYRKIKLTI